MAARKTRLIALIGVLVGISAAGCEAWRIEETPTPGPQALTPTAVFTETPAIPPTSTALPATITPTITLTPVHSPTSPLGPTSTPAEGDLTATAINPAIAGAPTVAYFVAFPEEPAPEEPLLLFWDSQGGISAAIYRLNLDGTPGRTWQVDPAGSLTVTPRFKGREETYVLTVTNGVATIEARISVRVGCDLEWFFEPPPEEGCPSGDPVIRTAMAQEFERGRMFWIGEQHQIIVLFDAPTVLPESEEGEEEEVDLPPAWIMVDDPFTEDTPEEDPEIQPPEGLFQPRRGFGVLWRENPKIRDRLGWATGEEIPFVMTTQVETLPEIEILYFSDQNGGIIILEPDGVGWQVIAYR